MPDPDLLLRVPRFTAVAAFAAAVASALAAACSGTTPPASASHPAQPPVMSSPSAAPTALGAPPAPAGTSCIEQQAALADAGRAVDTARERKAGAWKLIVPFAVLARRAQAGNELEAAEQQLATLQAKAAREGCGGGR